MSAPRLIAGAKHLAPTATVLAILGLLLTLLISPAMARHDTPEPEVAPTVVTGNPACPVGTTEIKFEASLGEVAVGVQKTSSIGSVTVRVEILATDGTYVTFDVDNAVAAYVLVKGGTDANQYDYTGLAAGGIRHDDHLIAPPNGGEQQPAISHVSFCLTLATQTATPEPTPATATPAPTPPAGDQDASLNIRKNDQVGHRLAGAVFTVEGQSGTFTTDENGTFCITGLPDDSQWLVTEIQAPAGYVIGNPASQLVEVDNDGDCNSPDAIFTNLVVTETATPTPEGSAQGGTSTPSPTPEGSVQGGTSTPSSSPEGSVQGGTGTPEASQPDTAMGELGGPNPIATVAFAFILVGALGTLAWANVRSVRRRA